MSMAFYYYAITLETRNSNITYIVLLLLFTQYITLLPEAAAPPRGRAFPDSGH